MAKRTSRMHRVLDWFGPFERPFPMADQRILEEIGARVSEVLKSSPARDVEKNLRALLMAFFDRFDLVMREDFEAQKRVLERAQVQLAELETRLAEIERRSATLSG